MESEQTGRAFSLPLFPEHVRANSPVEFAHDYLYPSPAAHDTVSFGPDDILLTAASDSEDFGPVLADALPSSGQEVRPSAAYSELVDVLSRATEKLSLDWPDEPRESQASKLDERFLSGLNSRPERRKLPFFSDLHQEISRSWKQPFPSRLTNTAAADFTNLVGSVEQGYTAIPVVEDTLASHLSPSLVPSWKSRPLLPFRPLSESPTSQPIRQAWPSIRWLSSKPTRRMSLRRWMKGLVWLQRQSKSWAGPLTWLWEPPSTPHAWGALWRVQWPQSAICGSISLRFVRKRRCSCWMHPSHNLGCLERRLALWWRNFAPLRRSRLILSSSCLGGRGTTPLPPPPPCLESNPYPERSLLAGAAPKLRILPRPRSGEPVAGLFLTNDHADGLTWSGTADLPLRLLRVVPDPRVGMRRASSSLRGETRPQKRICPPKTRSPHSDLSQPPLEVWCAEKVQHQFSSVWQLGDALGLPPLPSVLLPPADNMIRDTIGSLLQRTDPVPAIFQSSASLFIIPNKDARGFPSWWRASLLTGPLDTPSQVCPPQHNTLLPLSHFIHEWERLPGEESPPLRRSSADSSKQCLEGFCATTGTFLPPTERSDRGNTSVGHRTRVFQPLLPCPKEGRRPETHSGSAAPEPFPLQREVQDADDEDDHVSDSRRGLVCHYRPKGCIFPHPGRPATQEVPSVCLWKEGLPIQGPSLRPGLGTENVHEMHGCCTGPLEVAGHLCSELLRRLAHSGPLQGVSESSQRYRSPPHSFSWPQNERQEECSFPLSANCIFGGSLEFRSDAGPFGSCPDIQFYSMSSPLQARPSCLSEYLPLGLLHMRPFLWWMKGLRLHPTIPATRLIRVSRSCFRPLSQCRDPAFLQSRVRMDAIHRRHMITTDASMTGWGIGQESSFPGT